MWSMRGATSGCASKDFTLRAAGKVRGVKKMSASLFLGFDEEGEGQEWHKVATGKGALDSQAGLTLCDDGGPKGRRS
jgi:hypothetical protein